jgi:hypothetical protein
MERAYQGGAAAWQAACRALAILLVAGCGLAGCTASGLLDSAKFGQPGFVPAGLSGTTVAFESIDGPPEHLFRKLVTQLTQEAQGRRLTVVSRESAAQYRVRGYVAAHIQGKKTTLSWVWDVFNTDEQLAVRFTGEVPSASSEQGWAAADDQAVTRMARDGMDRLAAFLVNPAADTDVAALAAPRLASAPGTGMEQDGSGSRR